MSTESIKKISKKQYVGKVYNLEVEPNDAVEDDQYYVCADTGIVVHNCHPRDNIALRYMAENLGLGYDLFDAIMRAREVQAENMAKRCLEFGKNVTIVGKAYKPNVPYTNGSSSMLVGHYVEKLGGTVNYYDIHTGDYDLKTDSTDVYLIGYWEQYVKELQFPVNSTVIDPWRRITAHQHAGNIVHYGNTR